MTIETDSGLRHRLLTVLREREDILEHDDRWVAACTACGVDLDKIALIYGLRRTGRKVGGLAP